MQFSAAQIAQIIGGQIEGDGNVSVGSFGKIEEAKTGQLAFLANPKYEEHLYSTGASIIIINQSQQLKQPVSATLIRVPDAYSRVCEPAGCLPKDQDAATIWHTGTAYIHPTATMGEQVFIGAFLPTWEKTWSSVKDRRYSGVFLGNNVVVGDNTILHAGVKIYHECVIGSQVIIHAGTVIGSDGFGFAPQRLTAP